MTRETAREKQKSAPVQLSLFDIIGQDTYV